MALKVSTAYILAGGQSRRMSSDKLFARIGGVSLLQHVLSTCRDHFDTVKIVARGKRKFRSLGCDVVLDWPNAQGPLAGIVAALGDCPDDCCFVTAADLHDLNADLILQMLNSYGGEQFYGVEENGDAQPLCGIYHRSSLSLLKKGAESGNYRMRDAIARMQCRFVAAPDGLWRNINQPCDLIEVRGQYD